VVKHYHDGKNEYSQNCHVIYNEYPSLLKSNTSNENLDIIDID